MRSNKLNWQRVADDKKVTASRVLPPFNPSDIRWYWSETERDRKYHLKPVLYVWKKDRDLCLSHYDPTRNSRYHRLITWLLSQED